MPLLTVPDILRLPASPATVRIAYGPDPNQFADLRLPVGNGPFPAAAIFHGGCWAEYADVAYTAPLATALVREGWATWNVEYRRVHQEGGGWPNTFTDAARGLDALRQAAADYPIDLDLVVAIGHSAGGQLALWNASRPTLPAASEVYVADPLPLQGAVSIGGIVDLGKFAREVQSPCSERLIRALGGTPEEYPARYAQVSPMERLPLDVPHLLIWGELDAIAPQALFQEYQTRSKARSISVPGAGHHELMSPAESAYRVLLTEINR